jgi:eukaryotic-like serine/threonine-protein kinase
MSDLVTSTFQYKKIKLIGEGSFGQVYHINDPQLNGKFAAKEIPKSEFRDNEISTLFAEAAAMNASHCQHVVRINAAGQNSEHVVLIMPYYPNGSLAEMIAEHPLQLSRALRV